MNQIHGGGYIYDKTVTWDNGNGTFCLQSFQDYLQKAAVQVSKMHITVVHIRLVFPANHIRNQSILVLSLAEDDLS